MLMAALVYQDNRSAAGRPDGSMQNQQDDHDEEEERDLQSRGSEIDQDGGDQLIRNKSNSFNASAYENVNIFGKKEIPSKSMMSVAEGKEPFAPARNGPIQFMHRYLKN